MERKMRRFKQQLAPEVIHQILRNGKYAVMAVAGDEGYPYAVPVNYVSDGNSIFIHSASQGHKIDALKRCPKCSLCIVDKDTVVPEEFTSYFRSVVVFGSASFVGDENDKVRALKLLCEKYSPGIDPTAEIAKFLKTVTIIEVAIEQVSGKEAIELVRARRADK